VIVTSRKGYENIANARNSSPLEIRVNIKKPLTNPRGILPVSPINIFAFGKLKNIKKIIVSGISNIETS
jgi:hypothetical protein